jgi:hypothetical protein
MNGVRSSSRNVRTRTLRKSKEPNLENQDLGSNQ